MNRFVYISSYHKMPYIERYILIGGLLMNQEANDWDIELMYHNITPPWE